MQCHICTTSAVCHAWHPGIAADSRLKPCRKYLPTNQPTDDKTVKVWDVSSEVCLQTLNIDKTLLSLSFNSTDCFLHSEIGSIAIHGPGTSSEIVVVEPARPQYRGTSLSSDSIWIKYDGRNVLWIPSEYRPSCSVVCGNRVGMGVGTGRVWTCRIDLG